MSIYLLVKRNLKSLLSCGMLRQVEILLSLDQLTDSSNVDYCGTKFLAAVVFILLHNLDCQNSASTFNICTSTLLQTQNHFFVRFFEVFSHTTLINGIHSHDSANEYVSVL